jgi:hypothetical protein
MCFVLADDISLISFMCSLTGILFMYILFVFVCYSDLHVSSTIGCCTIHRRCIISMRDTFNFQGLSLIVRDCFCLHSFHPLDVQFVVVFCTSLPITSIICGYFSLYIKS